MKIINENGRIGVEDLAEYQNLRLMSLLESMKKGDPKTYGIVAISLTRGNGFVHLDAENASSLDIMEGLVRGVARVILAITDNIPIEVRKEFTLDFCSLIKSEIDRLSQ